MTDIKDNIIKLNDDFILLTFHNINQMYDHFIEQTKELSEDERLWLAIRFENTYAEKLLKESKKVEGQG